MADNPGDTLGVKKSILENAISSTIHNNCSSEEEAVMNILKRQVPTKKNDLI